MFSEKHSGAIGVVKSSSTSDKQLIKLLLNSLQSFVRFINDRKDVMMAQNRERMG